MARSGSGPGQQNLANSTPQTFDIQGNHRYVSTLTIDGHLIFEAGPGDFVEGSVPWDVILNTPPGQTPADENSMVTICRYGRPPESMRVSEVGRISNGSLDTDDLQGRAASVGAGHRQHETNHEWQRTEPTGQPRQSSARDMQRSITREQGRNSNVTVERPQRTEPRRVVAMENRNSNTMIQPMVRVADDASRDSSYERHRGEEREDTRRSGRTVRFQMFERGESPRRK